MPEVVARKQLRAFGLIMGGGFACLGVWPLLGHGMNVRLWAVGLATLFLVSGLLWPSLLRYPYRLWMTIGHVLGALHTRLMLGVIFYALFTPIGFFRRLRGRDPMQRKTEPQRDTYRLIRQARPPSHMTHQF